MLFTLATYKAKAYGNNFMIWPIVLGWFISLGVISADIALMAYDIWKAPGAKLKEVSRRCACNICYFHNVLINCLFTLE